MMTHCPARDSLERLLADELPEPDRACVQTPSFALSMRHTSATRSQTSTGSDVVPAGLRGVPSSPHAASSMTKPTQIERHMWAV